MYICSQCKQIVGNESAFCPHDGAAIEQVKEVPPGSRLGQYLMVKKLGEGGMGYVFEARHETLNRRTAIKFLLPQFATNQVVVTRFLQEAKSVNLINHENIINVYDYGVAPDKSVFFVMEYLEGEAFNDFLKRVKKLKPEALIPIFTQMYKALAAAHEKDIIHRDLKPANIFLQRREGNPYFVKLLDFGIAKLRGDGAVEGLTKQGALLGTPQFMSPEQVNGVAVDARSDLFSMGVILYRAAVGKLPFSGKGFAVIADQILNETPAPPRKEDPEIPEALESIILKSLAKERDDRYVSAREILKDLDALRESLGIAADALPIIEGDTLAKPAREASPKTPNPTTSTGEHSSVGDASVLEFQGEGKSNPNIPQKAAPALAPAQAAPAPAPNRTPLMVGLALVAALGIGAVFVLGMGGGNSTPNPTPAPTPAPAPAEKTFEELRSDKEALRSLARKKIDEEITSGDSPKLLAMAKALDAVGTPRSAPFLYKLVAMSGPDIKKTAAYALRDLKLPEAAPQVREGLSNADKNTKIHLSGVMLALGDKDAKPSLQKELSGPVALKLAAAKALAKAGEKEPADIVAILQEAMQGPEGSQFWLDGAEGLAALGDETAKTKLQEARAKPDEKLVLSVLSLLSQGGDTEAKAQLARNVENPDYARRYEAALILARLGDPAGIGAAKEGAKAPDPVDRAASLATLGRFPSAANAVDVLIEATRDSDLVVRYTALAALLAIE